MSHYPLAFYITAAVLMGLFGELWRHRSQPWALPATMVYVVIGTWYYADPIFSAGEYASMPAVVLQYSYLEVLAFLVVFRGLVPYCAKRIAPPSTAAVSRPLGPESLLPMTVIIWAVLFVCALSRMDWDIFGALLPLDSRMGNQMWARAAAGDAGPMGFLVSTGSYLYVAVCSFFGILAVLVRKPLYKTVATLMMLISWPFFLLGGTRNAFLVVSTPWIFGYFLLGRQPKVVRYAVLVGLFLFLNFAFKVVLSHRNVGFREYFAGTEDVEVVENNAEQGHLGLNMIQELCYINIFQITGQTHLTWGTDYLTQITAIIPRAIWPGKPLMGIEYAKLRGFGGGDNDIGVFATLSTGIVGQGVLEYGPFFGPLAPAVLMALWCGLLARWWRQRASILRLGLFLLAFGITFNLGRNITSITLWPVLFTYLGVRLLEKFLPYANRQRQGRRKKVNIKAVSTPRPSAARPATVRAVPVADGLGQP